MEEGCASKTVGHAVIDTVHQSSDEGSREFGNPWVSRVAPKRMSQRSVTGFGYSFTLEMRHERDLVSSTGAGD